MKGVRLTMCIIIVIMLSAGLAFSAAQKEKAEFPSKAIELVTYSSVGGGGDVTARQLQKPLEEIFDVPIVVVNKPGAGGSIAMEYVDKHDHDGHTLLIGTCTAIISPHFTGSPYSLKDFAAVRRLMQEYEAFFVKAGSQYQTMQDFVDAAKQKPKGIPIGGALLGGIDSLIVALVCNEADIPFNYVPFEGGGESLTALLGGHVPIVAGSASEIVGSIEAGQIEVLAFTSEKRIDRWPDVPTMQECGIDVVASNWRGVFAGKNTPQENLEILYKAIDEAFYASSFQKFMENANSFDASLELDKFDKLVVTQYEDFGTIIQKMGISED